MGRPTKLTPAVLTTLVFALSEGATIEHACDYAAIAPSTFYEWMKRGEGGDPEFLEFLETITRARGRGIVTDLSTISKAVLAGDWKAAAWRLEHRYPAEYGKKVQVRGDADNPLTVLHRMPQEQLEAKIAQLLEQCGYAPRDEGTAALPAPTEETDATS
jgi:hypothetical protein